MATPSAPSYGAIDMQEGQNHLLEYHAQIHNFEDDTTSGQSGGGSFVVPGKSTNAASADFFEECLMHESSQADLELREYGSDYDLDLSPRTRYKQMFLSPDKTPSKHLKCLWFIMILILLLSLLLITCQNQYILNIYARFSGDSTETYYWSFGWNSQEFHAFQNNKQDSISRNQLSLKFTQRYAQDAGDLTMMSIVIILICLIFSMIMLCCRSVNEHPLYIKCCTVRIPQTPTLYIMFSIIKHYSRVCIYYYLFTIVYGLLEINYDIAYACVDGTCMNFAIPHYGLCALFIIGLFINCCITKRLVTLDLPFNMKTLGNYYPEHVRKMNAQRCVNINLGHLRRVLHSIRLSLICASMLWFAFNETGLIAILVWNEDKSTFYLQYVGLVNDRNEAINGNGVGDQADAFVNVCYVFQNVLLPIILCFNVLLLFYFWSVVKTFRAIGICKFVIVLFMFIEWLSFTVISILYYYGFSVFWSDYLKENRETNYWFGNNVTYSVWWLPDWGLIIVLILNYYLFKSILCTFKAI